MKKPVSWLPWFTFWLTSMGNFSNFSETLITEDSITFITESGEQLVTEGK